ncbi:MAG: UDP-glucose/GDP-mannose dehydrogenase family protein [Patescibacteria group bacterium]|jgi:UDPglucose 6-dehydrogenase
MQITIIGTGYVGLVTGVGLAQLGHRVFCVDTDPAKIATLKAGKEPFYEPGLTAMLKKNIKAKRLFFTVNLAEVVNNADLIIICVGTPAKPNGSADLTYVNQAALGIKEYCKTGKIVVTKSTVPVGNGKILEKLLNSGKIKSFKAVACSEFLREGKAIYDFFNPDRIIVGAVDKSAGLKVMSAFAKIKTNKMLTDRETAELIKYASNAFLAAKISFINEIANLCEKVGANVDEVAKGMGYDARINPHFLQAGIGYGGSCFPKDVRALKYMAEQHGADTKIIKAVLDVNANQHQLFLNKIKQVLGNLKGKKIGVLGLAFKNNTDDIRESVAIKLIKNLISLGAKVKAFDPKATANAKKVLLKGVLLADSSIDVFTQADALIIATEWPEFAKLDWLKVKKSMKQPIIFDGRNLLNKSNIVRLGFKYYSIGR